MKFKNRGKYVIRQVNPFWGFHNRHTLQRVKWEKINLNKPPFSSILSFTHISQSKSLSERKPQKQRTFLLVNTHGRPSPGNGNYHHCRLYNVVVFLNFLNFDFIFSSIKYKWRFEIEKKCVFLLGCRKWMRRWKLMRRRV